MSKSIKKVAFELKEAMEAVAPFEKAFIEKFESFATTVRSFVEGSFHGLEFTKGGLYETELKNFV